MNLPAAARALAFIVRAAWINVFAASAAWGVATEQTARTLSITPGDLVLLATDLGDVDVQIGLEPRVRIVVERTVVAASAALEQAALRDHQVEIESTGRGVRVRAGAGRGGPWRRVVDDPAARVHVTFAIVAPEEIALELQTGKGNIGVAGVRGPVQADTGRGDLMFERIEGAIVARTERGRVRLNACAGIAKARTAAGVIEARDGSGAFTLESAQGSVIVRAHRGDLRAQASGGGITADLVHGNLRAQTGDGSIRAVLRAVPTDSCLLSTNQGALSLTFPSASGVEIDALATSGEITASFPVAPDESGKTSRLKTALNGGGPLLFLRTESGAIELIQQ